MLWQAGLNWLNDLTTWNVLLDKRGKDHHKKCLVCEKGVTVMARLEL